MSRRNRRRTSGQTPSGKYAPIPTEVLKKACNELSGPELKSFLAICSQSQHWNNGTAKLCRSVIKEWKLGSNTTVTLAKNKMILHGLICQTRTAAQKRCAMYGVMYLALNQDEMAKQGCCAPNTIALNDRSALQTVVAQQRNSVRRTNATGIVALAKKRNPSATDTVASEAENAPPALHALYQSKNLPCPTGFSESTCGSHVATVDGVQPPLLAARSAPSMHAPLDTHPSQGNGVAAVPAASISSMGADPFNTQLAHGNASDVTWFEHDQHRLMG